jgi:hypothetical protein
LVTARELQLHHPEFNVNGVAALDGPHDLSGHMMREVMLKARYPEPYTSPFFFTFMADAYDRLFPDLRHADGSRVFGWDESIINHVQAPEWGDFGEPTWINDFPDRLRILQNGDYEGDYVLDHSFKLIPAIWRGWILGGPASAIFTSRYQLEASDPHSLMTQVLSRSDSFRGWVPSFPVVLIHNFKDDLVPAENSRIAYQHFREWGDVSVSLELFADETGIGGMTPLALQPLIWVVDWTLINNFAMKDVHVRAYFPAMERSLNWINSERRKSNGQPGVVWGSISPRDQAHLVPGQEVPLEIDLLGASDGWESAVDFYLDGPGQGSILNRQGILVYKAPINSGT